MHVVVQMIGKTMEWGGLRDYWVKKRVKTWPDVPCLSSDNSKRELKATHIGRWVEYIESTWAVYSVDIHPLYSVDRTIWNIGTYVILDDSKTGLEFIGNICPHIQLAILSPI